MAVAQQVIAVFSGVRGFLDDVEIADIKNTEKLIYEEVKTSGSVSYTHLTLPTKRIV